jgi:hypothetical protein
MTRFWRRTTGGGSDRKEEEEEEQQEEEQEQHPFQQDHVDVTNFLDLLNRRVTPPLSPES